MMNQHERERLKQQGLLREPPAAARGAARGGYRGNRGGRGGRGGRGNRGGQAAPAPVQNRVPFPSGPHQPPQHPPYPPYPPMAHRPYQPTPNAAAPNGPQSLPTSQNRGGQPEMEQAKLICGKTMRLLLQTDVFIHHDGKISVGGTPWTRIGVERQRDVVGMFDGLCHLPRFRASTQYSIRSQSLRVHQLETLRNFGSKSSLWLVARSYWRMDVTRSSRWLPLIFLLAVS